MPRKLAPEPKKAPRKRVPAKKTPAKRAPRKRAAVKLTVVPEVFDPRYEAHRLHLTGKPWREIAHRVGYATEIAAQHAVQNYLQQAAMAESADAQQAALRTQLDRYEETLNSWWEEAMVGLPRRNSDGILIDPVILDKSANAANVVLKTLAQIDKLRRFGEGDTKELGRTIVIEGPSAEYIAQLQAVIEDDRDST